jgi:hypothetical protein
MIVLTRKWDLKLFIEPFYKEAIPILRECIFIVPETQALGGEIKIPISYNYEDNHTSYAFTSIPIYTSILLITTSPSTV